MTLEKKINADINEAMKMRNQQRLMTLRSIKAELLLMATSGQAVTEAGEMKMLQKLVKQRKEAADLFESQNRMDLAETEIFQADLISEYLPKQLSEAELLDELKKIIEESGATNSKDMGAVMARANKELAGRSDGKTISEKVKQLLGT